MPTNYPTYRELVDRVRSDVQNLLPDLDPNVFGSIIRAFTDSTAGRAYDIVLMLKELERQLFPTTATGEFLDIWALYEGLARKGASKSSGSITVTGTAASGPVPLGTLYANPAGLVYSVIVASPVFAANTVSATSLTRSTSVASAVTSTPHRLSSGMTITIAGATETDYNGSWVITVTGEDSFDYDLGVLTPTTPASGTITASFDGAFATVESVANGSDNNMVAGSRLSLQAPIAGVDGTAYVQYNGVLGGTDEETDADLRARIFQARSSILAAFNPARIKQVAMAISGVTRVKVNRVTPAVGDVTVYFVRDSDTNPIPTASQVAEVDAAIRELLPADKADADLIVDAPTAVVVDFTFTSLTPSTATMQSAVTNSLDAYLQSLSIEDNVLEASFNSAIVNAIDPTTGDRVTAFVLSSPATDVSVGAGKVAVLGDVNY